MLLSFKAFYVCTFQLLVQILDRIFSQIFHLAKSNNLFWLNITWEHKKQPAAAAAATLTCIAKQNNWLLECYILATIATAVIIDYFPLPINFLLCVFFFALQIRAWAEMMLLCVSSMYTIHWKIFPRFTAQSVDDCYTLWT